MPNIVLGANAVVIKPAEETYYNVSIPTLFAEFSNGVKTDNYLLF